MSVLWQLYEHFEPCFQLLGAVALYISLETCSGSMVAYLVTELRLLRLNSCKEGIKTVQVA